MNCFRNHSKRIITKYNNLGNRPARVWWTKMSRLRCKSLERGMQLTTTTDSRLA